MISSYSGINLPHEIIAGDNSADNLIHFVYACCGYISRVHCLMLEPGLIRVKALN